MTTVKNLPELEEVLKANERTLMVVKAPWCGVCKMMEPVFNALEKENQSNVKMIYVNAEDSSDITDKYHINALPAFVLFEGTELFSFDSGGKPKAALQEMINKKKE